MRKDYPEIDWRKLRVNCSKYSACHSFETCMLRVRTTFYSRKKYKKGFATCHGAADPFCISCDTGLYICKQYLGEDFRMDKKRCSVCGKKKKLDQFKTLGIISKGNVCLQCLEERKK